MQTNLKALSDSLKIIEEAGAIYRNAVAMAQFTVAPPTASKLVLQKLVRMHLIKVFGSEILGTSAEQLDKYDVSAELRTVIDQLDAFERENMRHSNQIGAGI